MREVDERELGIAFEALHRRASFSNAAMTMFEKDGEVGSVEKYLNWLFSKDLSNVPDVYSSARYLRELLDRARMSGDVLPRRIKVPDGFSEWDRLYRRIDTSFAFTPAPSNGGARWMFWRNR